MDVTGERYHPSIDNAKLLASEPYISYEHWHRYLLATRFVAGKTVLDIASGEGYGSRCLANVAAQVVGVDVSPEAVEHAGAKYVADNLRFVCGSAGAIPIPGTAVFDSIVSFETIEHLDRATQHQFAGEIKRLLKPAGTLLISTPNTAVYSGPAAESNPFHLQEFSQAEFLEYLGKHFAHVRLLSQRVYPCSYVWNPAATARCGEYQIDLDDNQFAPAVDDRKEALYFIAVCSDEAQVEPEASVLLDLSETAFRGIGARETQLYLDYGRGFGTDVAVTVADYSRGEFSISFDLDAARPLKAVRWDPLEQRLCRLWLNEVSYTDDKGNVSHLDPSTLRINGARRADGALDFETIDPNVHLPITGCVVSINLRGRCEVVDAETSLASIFRSLNDAQTTVYELGTELNQERAANAERVRLLEAHCQRLERRLNSIPSVRIWRLLSKLRSKLSLRRRSMR